MTEKDSAIDSPSKPTSWNWRPKVEWFASEIVVIVAGVLIALAANAWIGDRAERLEEHSILLGLKADFETNLVRLDSLIVFHREAHGDGQTLLSFAGPGATPPDPAVFDSLLVGVITWETFEPIDGRLTALLSSGRIGILQSDNLQAALAGWASDLEDLRENETYAQDLQLHLMNPYLYDKLSIRTMDWHTGLDGADTQSRFATDYISLVSDLRFENLIADRMANTTFLIEDASQLRTTIVDMLRLIDQEL